MHRTPKIIEAAAVEPITVNEARAHLEAQPYEDSDVDPIDEAMLEGWIAAAREYCEDFTGLSFATRTLEIALDQFPAVRADGSLGIELPWGPVRTVEILVPADDDVSSDDADSDAVADAAVYADGTVNPTTYVLDTYRRPNQVTPVTSWPTVTAATNAIRLRYVAGYGVDSDGGEELPKMLRAGLLLVLGHLYANREATSAQALSVVPMGVQSMLRPHRVRLGMA